MKTCSLVAAVTLAACAQTQSDQDASTSGMSSGAATPSAMTPSYNPTPTTTAPAGTVPAFADAPQRVIVLTGDAESPPVATAASGRALILVDDDGMMSGVVEAPGMAGSTAAIEDDAADADGTLVVLLVPTADGRWQVPAGTRLTAKQRAHHASGKLYANVRSKAHPKGEVRAQLQGSSRTSTSANAASSPRR
jgi:ABC-type Fe3+-hydroxamate transport system substrate-binding protein